MPWVRPLRHARLFLQAKERRLVPQPALFHSAFALVRVLRQEIPTRAGFVEELACVLTVV